MQDLSSSNCLISQRQHRLSSAVKFNKIVSSPRFYLWLMILQIGNGSFCVASLLNMSLKSFVNVIMEWIFKSECVFLSGSLDSDSQSTDDGSVASPWIRNKSGSIEKSRSNNISFKILFYSTLLDGPIKNLDIRICVISDLNLMKSIAIPVVALSDVAVVEIEVSVVVISEVVRGIDIRSGHLEINYNPHQATNVYLLFVIFKIIKTYSQK